jgi:beta-glucosidase
VQGCFYWTLLDHFEWANGTKERFGLIHTDDATSGRRLKK